MFVPEELKGNKFADCRIPSNKEYFSRFGISGGQSGQFTGDEVAPQPMNKVDSIADYEAYAEMKQREANGKE